LALQVDLIALVRSASEEELRLLAESLKPYLPEPEANGRWLRGSKAIGAHVDLSGAAVRRRKCEAEDIPVSRQGRDLVAYVPDLDAWMGRGNGRGNTA